MRQIKINSTIGNEILSIQDVKDYVRIDTSDDDNLISAMIIQARIWCENFISRDIVPKNRTYYLDSTSGTFDLPFSPVDSIELITINGVTTTSYEILGLNNETLELDQGPADDVKITYITSGLNDGLIKQSMLQLISTYYDNRADFVEGSSTGITKSIEIPTSSKLILTSYKTMFI